MGIREVVMRKEGTKNGAGSEEEEAAGVFHGCAAVNEQ